MGNEAENKAKWFYIIYQSHRSTITTTRAANDGVTATEETFFSFYKLNLGRCRARGPYDTCRLDGRNKIGIR